MFGHNLPITISGMSVTGEFSSVSGRIKGEMRITGGDFYIGRSDRSTFIRGTMVFFRKKGADKYYYLHLESGDLFYSDDMRMYLSEVVSPSNRDLVYDMYEKIGINFPRTESNTVYRESFLIK